MGQNIGPFDGRPGPGKVGHKSAKAPPLVTSPPRELKTENFSDSELEDLLNP